MVSWNYLVALCLLIAGSQLVISETTKATEVASSASQQNTQPSDRSQIDLGNIFQLLLPLLNGANNDSAIDVMGLLQQLTPLLSGNGGISGISDLLNMIPSQLLGDKCAKDGLELLKDLTSFKMWALQMIDASGKPSRNLLQGNNIWFGSYDDCLKIHHTVPDNTGHVIDGAYAQINLQLPPNITAIFNSGLGMFGGQALGIRWDLCIPKSCSGDQIKSMLNITQLRSLGLTVASVDFAGPKSLEGDTAAYVSIAILGCFVLLCIIGTIWDVVQDRYTISKKTSGHQVQNTCKQNGVNGVHLKEVTILNDKTQFCNGGESNVKQGLDNPSFTPVDQSQSNGTSQTNGISQPNGISKSSENSQPKSTCNGVGEKTNSKSVPEKSSLSRIFLAFSVRENGRKLLNCSSPPGSLGCLNGIRVLSMAWVILGHYMSFCVRVIENKTDMINMSKTFWFQVILNGTLSVDTFFFLSGLLVSYLFIREVKKTRKISAKQMGLFYFHRFWRLTPLYMIVIMIYTNIAKYFNEGPLEVPALEEMARDSCRKYWWTNLLYINNLYKSGQNEMCMAWSWYLANDMQFYVLSPLAIVPLALGYRVIGLLVIMCMVASQIISTGYIGWDIGDPSLFSPNAGRFFTELYVKPYVRIGVYAIGLLLGYVINKIKGKQHIPKVVLFVGTLVAGTAGLLVNYLTYDQVIGDHTPWGPDSNITFQTLFRLVWALVLFWLIFVCVHGYGGFVNTILSWGAWIPLSRLTYAAYLIHLIVMASFTGNMRGFGYTNGFYIMNNYIGIFAITYAASFIISVVVEAPFLALEKVMLKR
ncbi:hypothetical protein LOTGIDRAFT_230482 [Lottia gigantea]|uniref:Nose resistant-to-fluoxetine protein N-terminal domain-containing protein n=1 Tax=Lottia gigantea TaxID=225164 RepID=V4CL89_LOTGI|nr:hypothetical protein LOTGIDRAFT_230482 [Lottia gigantea]ESP03045.1 hypothetical protein LOTGIDRAFT_230482 [Lottia gigantea]